MKPFLLAGTIATLSVAPAVRASAQAMQLPSTPAGRAVQGWLHAVNSADSVLMRAFGRDSMVPVGTDSSWASRRAEALVKFHAIFGEATPELIRASSDTELSLVMRSGKDGSSNLFMFYTEPAAPYRLAAIFHVGAPR